MMVIIKHLIGKTKQRDAVEGCKYDYKRRHTEIHMYVNQVGDEGFFEFLKAFIDI